LCQCCWSLESSEPAGLDYRKCCCRRCSFLARRQPPRQLFLAGDTATACAGSSVRLCPPGLKGSLVFLLPIRYRTALAKEIRGASSLRENHSLMGIAPVSSICRQYSCSSSGRTSQGRFHPVSQRRSVSSTGYSVKKCPASITGMRDSSSA